MHLQIFDRDDKIGEVQLSDKPVTIGRDASCDVVLRDPSVSRTHARIEPKGRFYVIRDNGSTNGTMVNSRVVSLHVLEQGDLIRVGKFIVKVLAPPGRRGDTSKIRVEKMRSANEARVRKGARLKPQFRPGETAAEAAVLGERERLLRLYEIQQKLGFLDSLDSLQSQALEIMLRELRADRGCILLGDFERVEQVETAADLDASAVAYLRGDQVVWEGEEIIIPREFLEHVLNNRTGASRDDPDVLPGMGAPFEANGRILGIVYLERMNHAQPFHENELRFLTLISSMLAVNLTNTLLYEEVCGEKEKLQAMIAGLSEGVLITDSRFRILDASALASTLLGEHENLIGKSFLELLRGFECSLDMALVEAEIDRGGAMFEIASAGESPRSLKVRIIPFVGRISGIRGRIILLVNATEARRTEELKTAFIRRIAHKLRTPLTVIEGNLPLLRTGIPQDSPESEVLGDIEKYSGVLCELVNGFVDFMEMELQTSRTLLATAVLSPRTALRGALRKIEAAISARRILVADRLPETLPRVRAEEHRLVRALTNLLDNAVKFSPEGGIVTVEAQTDGKVLRLHVIDEGPGIPGSEQESVFQVFHQVDEEFTGEVPGLGLGLAVARQIVLELGGDIQLTSPYGFPDHGLRVTVLLPVHSGEGRPDPPEEAGAGRRMRDGSVAR